MRAKRFAALLLALVVVSGMLMSTVFADTTPGQPQDETSQSGGELPPPPDGEGEGDDGTFTFGEGTPGGTEDGEDDEVVFLDGDGNKVDGLIDGGNGELDSNINLLTSSATITSVRASSNPSNDTGGNIWVYADDPDPNTNNNIDVYYVAGKMSTITLTVTLSAAEDITVTAINGTNGKSADAVGKGSADSRGITCWEGVVNSTTTATITIDVGNAVYPDFNTKRPEVKLEVGSNVYYLWLLPVAKVTVNVEGDGTVRYGQGNDVRYNTSKSAIAVVSTTTASKTRILDVAYDNTGHDGDTVIFALDSSALNQQVSLTVDGAAVPLTPCVSADKMWGYDTKSNEVSTAYSTKPDELWYKVVNLQSKDYVVNVSFSNLWNVTFESNGGSAVASKTAADGGKVTAPATPTRPGYSFVGWYKEAGLQNAWNFSTDTVTGNTTLFARWSVIPVDDDDDDDDYVGSSSGGGGSSSGSSNIPTTVTPEIASNAVNEALQQAAESGSDTATARIYNPGDVSLDTLKSMQNPDVNVTLNADNLNPSGTGVEVRISLDPSQSTKDLDLSASTSDSNARNTNEVFQSYFQNNTNTVSFGQQGDFGQSVRVAVKPDPDLNTDNLYFYAYDKETNTYTQLTNADYFVDANGYVHFTTSVGGSIIMSDGPLTKK